MSIWSLIEVIDEKRNLAAFSGTIGCKMGMIKIPVSKTCDKMELFCLIPEKNSDFNCFIRLVYLAFSYFFCKVKKVKSV
jgi:hypothetical protein